MYEKRTLPNGLRIVYEKIPYVRSVAFGIWVGFGSRYETTDAGGACHFIEHMVFKGTETRTAADIAEAMDSIGGQINAFTAKECTCFYGRVLDDHLTSALDVLCDMFFGSRFAEEDAKNELGVILEEIDMYEDSPEDLVFERLFEAVYKSSPLGKPVLGRASSLKKMSGAFLRDYMSRNYRADRTVISLCGSFDDSAIDLISERFSAMMPLTKPPKIKAAAYTPAFVSKRKSIEQNHLCIAFPSLSMSSPDRFGMQLLSSILGGGMSSRLFQVVREKLGLCYSIYTFGASHDETGIFSIYTALSRETEHEAIAAISREVRKLTAEGVTERELERAREQVKSNVLMGLESTSSRANNLGKGELLLGRMLTSDEIIAAYDAVTRDQIKLLAETYLAFSKLSFSCVGRVGDTEKYREIILNA